MGALSLPMLAFVDRSGARRGDHAADPDRAGRGRRLGVPPHGRLAAARLDAARRGARHRARLCLRRQRVARGGDGGGRRDLDRCSARIGCGPTRHAPAARRRDSPDGSGIAVRRRLGLHQPDRACRPAAVPALGAAAQARRATCWSAPPRSSSRRSTGSRCRPIWRSASSPGPICSPPPRCCRSRSLSTIAGVWLVRRIAPERFYTAIYWLMILVELHWLGRGRLSFHVGFGVIYPRMTRPSASARHPGQGMASAGKVDECTATPEFGGERFSRTGWTPSFVGDPPDRLGEQRRDRQMADLGALGDHRMVADRIGDHQFAQRRSSTRATAPPDSTPWVT